MKHKTLQCPLHKQKNATLHLIKPHLVKRSKNTLGLVVLLTFCQKYSLPSWKKPKIAKCKEHGRLAPKAHFSFSFVCVLLFRYRSLFSNVDVTAVLGGRKDLFNFPLGTNCIARIPSRVEISSVTPSYAEKHSFSRTTYTKARGS